jgi:hypothetical protein
LLLLLLPADVDLSLIISFQRMRDVLKVRLTQQWASWGRQPHRSLSCRSSSSARDRHASPALANLLVVTTHQTNVVCLWVLVLAAMMSVGHACSWYSASLSAAVIQPLSFEKDWLAVVLQQSFCM